jgi:hypothetical protein
MRPEGLGKLEKIVRLIGSRNRDLLFCNVVPHRVGNVYYGTQKKLPLVPRLMSDVGKESVGLFGRRISSSQSLYVQDTTKVLCSHLGRDIGCPD